MENIQSAVTAGGDVFAFICRRRFNIDHLCRLNIDQGLKLAG
jgi:hypothetical protein